MNPPEHEHPATPDPEAGHPAEPGDFAFSEEGPYTPPEADGESEEFASSGLGGPTPMDDEYCLPEGAAPPPLDDLYFTPPHAGTLALPKDECVIPPAGEPLYSDNSESNFPSEPENGITPPEYDSAASVILPEEPGTEFADGRPSERAYSPPGVPDEEVALLCEGLERFLGANEARVHVLRGVSLRLEPGFVHAVVGPSGCGKSSLLYILGLLDRPDAGRLVISGRPVADLPDDELSRQRNALLGFIFQFHFLLQDFTAQENVMIPMRQLGVLSEASMRDRARHLLDAVGMGEKAQRPSRHLSGGEQQRVAIARALANDPQVILADEPTGNLDTANSTRVFSLLTDLVHRENKALLLVTHNPAIAEACDWVHTMRDGLIVEQQFVGARG